MAKRIITALRLNEISAVDKPAQVHARALIMKRADPLAFGDTLVDRVAKTAFDLVMDDKDENGARTFSDLIDEAEQRERRYEANEELWPLFSALEESIKSIVTDQSLDNAKRLEMIRDSVQGFMNAVAAAVPDVEAVLQKFIEAGGLAAPIQGDRQMDLQKQIDELTAKLEESTKAIEAATQRADKAEAINALSAEERAFHDDLPDDTAKAEFIAKSATDRAALITAKAADDAVVYTSKADGTEYRKSDDPRLVAMAKREDQRVAETAEATKRADLAEATKRVETDFGNLPGEPVAKAKAIVALKSLDDTVAEAIEAMLKAGNAAMAETMIEVGHGGAGGASGSNEDKLDQMAKAHQVANPGTSYHDAYDAVLNTPEGSKLYTATKRIVEKAA